LTDRNIALAQEIGILKMELEKLKAGEGEKGRGGEENGKTLGQ
jgi:hypothetical protein